MSTSPIALTVPARVTVSHVTGRTITIHLPVYDTGRLPLQVTASAGAYSKLAQLHPAAPWVTSITPQTFTLQPRASVTVTLTLTVPAGAKGQHALNAVFSARPSDPVAGNITVTGAVASTVLVDLPGKDTAAHVPVMVRPAAPAGFPVMPVAGGGSVVLVAALGAVLVRRRFRPRGAHHA